MTRAFHQKERGEGGKKKAGGGVEERHSFEIGKRSMISTATTINNSMPQSEPPPLPLSQPPFVLVDRPPTFWPMRFLPKETNTAHA